MQYDRYERCITRLFKLPAQTVVLLNHESSFEVLKDNGLIKTISNGNTAWSLAGKFYNQETTIYFLPSGQIKPGSMINDWDDLPAKTRLIIGYKGPYKLNKYRTACNIGVKDNHFWLIKPSNCGIS